ncbi:MAG: hypothetical protein O3B65_06450, partial [Chloroflexi bacterium]|nr:hypothetical protein [Chloroflexota bacterium]
GIFVTGYFQGELNVDVEGVDAYGGRDVFVLKYNPVTDTVEWAVSAGDTDEWDVGRALAIDPLTEDIWVTGYFEGTADFGNGTVFANETQGNIFVSRYSKNGTPKGGASFGNASGVQTPFGIVADGFGGAVIAAHTYSLVNFGGGSLGDEGGSDIVMLKVDQDFGHVWSNAYGSIGDDGVQAMTQIGNLPIVVGYTNGTIDFGSETYPGIGDLDMFILKTAP